MMHHEMKKVTLYSKVLGVVDTIRQYYTVVCFKTTTSLALRICTERSSKNVSICVETAVKVPGTQWPVGSGKQPKPNYLENQPRYSAVLQYPVLA
jgi:hypothetical protein